MCRLKHKEGQFSHRPLLSPMKGRGRTDAGRGDGTDTKLGPSELMKERHRRENREGERERECPSNWYTETEGEIQGAREDLSLEDMSNSHATGSNAWESRQLLSGLTAASLTFFFYCLQCQTTARETSQLCPAGETSCSRPMRSELIHWKLHAPKV